MALDINQEELFQIKSKFLSEIPHPKLILKAIVQTQNGCKSIDDIKRQSIPNENDELILVLKKYVEELIQVKLQISNALTGQELNIALIQLYKLHWSFLFSLSSYMSELELYPDENLKISDSIDAYSLIKFLEVNHIKENQIKTYICNTISNKSPEDFDVLTIACLRSRKISEHARSI